MRTFFFFNFYTPQDINFNPGEIVKTSRFKDLDIVSAKKPQNMHLWLEVNSAGSHYIVSTGDLTHLWYSDDKMDTEAKIDIDPGDAWGGDDDHRPANIISAWHDRANKIIYFVDHSGGNTIYAWKLDYSASESAPTITEMSTIAGLNAVTGADIYISGSNLVIVYTDGDEVGVNWWVDPNWVSKDTEEIDSICGFAIVPSSRSLDYILLDAPLLDNVLLVSITKAAGVLNQIAQGGDTSFPSVNQRGISFDGIDFLSFTLTKDADGKEYLYSYSTIDEPVGFTELAEYNIALQLDRNTASGVFEKGFSIDASKTVYEIKARLGGIRQLQKMSAITDAVIIAITDNFLMNDDGDMFEFSDVTKEISTIRYTDGIIGVEKRGIFTVHPDFHINWNEGDSIKIYDDNDLLEFHGLITNKNRGNNGLYVYKIDSFTNEIYRKTYENAYTGDDTDTKQKDIIDNACDFCYRSSSIVGTTTNYDYAYNRDLIYLFWLARFLERQVPYVEPDGKIWTKAHDGLAKNDMIYPGTYINNPTLGLTGTDIPFVDSATLHDGAVEIVSDWQSHRKVLRLQDDVTGGEDPTITHNETQATAGTREFWFGTNNVNQTWSITLNENGVGTIIGFRIFGTDIDWLDSGAIWQKIDDAANDILYHIKIVWRTDNTHDIYVNGTKEVDNQATRRNMTSGIDEFTITASSDSNQYCYLDAYGDPTNDTAYAVGDNEVAWDIANHWQEVFLVDIPGIEERIQGFFSGNSGITRNTIRYKNNATAIRPVAATRDPIEQLQGILPLNEFRDPKIVAATEANQLGDNRYAIWSSDIIFLGLRIQGQGYLQPGKTIEIQNTGQITITQDDFLIISFERDPKNDVYVNMILSDNIIFPAEFTNLQDTSRIQIHTASVQALENQAAIAGIKAPLIYPFFIFGTLGFVETGNYGACLEVAFSDTNATINSSFWVHEGGNFKIRIIHSGSGNNFGKTIGGIYSISHDVDGGLQTWDVGTIDFNIPADDNRVIGVDDSAVAYTIASNSKVGLHYAKDDNAGGAAGNMQVYGIILVRQ